MPHIPQQQHMRPHNHLALSQSPPQGHFSPLQTQFESAETPLEEHPLFIRYKAFFFDDSLDTESIIVLIRQNPLKVLSTIIDILQKIFQKKLTATKQSFDEQTQTVEKKLKQLKQRLHDYLEENQFLKNEIDLLQKQTEKAQFKLDQSEDQMERTKFIVMEQNEQKFSIMRQNVKLCSQGYELRTRCGEMERQAIEMEERVQALQQKAKQQASNIGQLSHHNNALIQQAITMRLCADQLLLQNHKLKETLSEKQDQIANCIRQYNNLHYYNYQEHLFPQKCIQQSASSQQQHKHLNDSDNNQMSRNSFECLYHEEGLQGNNLKHKLGIINSHQMKSFYSHEFIYLSREKASEQCSLEMLDRVCLEQSPELNQKSSPKQAIPEGQHSFEGNGHKQKRKNEEERKESRIPGIKPPYSEMKHNKAAASIKQPNYKYLSFKKGKERNQSVKKSHLPIKKDSVRHPIRISKFQCKIQDYQPSSQLSRSRPGASFIIDRKLEEKNRKIKDLQIQLSILRELLANNKENTTLLQGQYELKFQELSEELNFTKKELVELYEKYALQRAQREYYSQMIVQLEDKIEEVKTVFNIYRESLKSKCQDYIISSFELIEHQYQIGLSLKPQEEHLELSLKPQEEHLELSLKPQEEHQNMFIKQQESNSSLSLKSSEERSVMLFQSNSSQDIMACSSFNLHLADINSKYISVYQHYDVDFSYSPIILSDRTDPPAHITHKTQEKDQSRNYSDRYTKMSSKIQSNCLQEDVGVRKQDFDYRTCQISITPQPNEYKDAQVQTQWAKQQCEMVQHESISIANKPCLSQILEVNAYKVEQMRSRGSTITSQEATQTLPEFLSFSERHIQTEEMQLGAHSQRKCRIDLPERSGQQSECYESRICSPQGQSFIGYFSCKLQIIKDSLQQLTLIDIKEASTSCEANSFLSLHSCLYAVVVQCEVISRNEMGVVNGGQGEVVFGQLRDEVGEQQQGECFELVMEYEQIDQLGLQGQAQQGCQLMSQKQLNQQKMSKQTSYNRKHQQYYQCNNQHNQYTQYKVIQYQHETTNQHTTLMQEPHQSIPPIPSQHQHTTHPHSNNIQHHHPLTTNIHHHHLLASNCQSHPQSSTKLLQCTDCSKIKASEALLERPLDIIFSTHKDQHNSYYFRKYIPEQIEYNLTPQQLPFLLAFLRQVSISLSFVARFHRPFQKPTHLHDQQLLIISAHQQNQPNNAQTFLLTNYRLFCLGSMKSIVLKRNMEMDGCNLVFGQSEVVMSERQLRINRGRKRNQLRGNLQDSRWVIVQYLETVMLHLAWP